ncbi:MAG: hypothetical protein M3Y27_27090, partial [Acidobacteriota bacterium]|nr:hypothetical protein [Acidobacteriota bacterium]
MGAGDYGGNVSVTGSSFGPDNKTTCVVLHVASQPIVRPHLAQPREAHVRIDRNGQKGNTVSMQVSIAPRLLLLGFGEYGLVVNQDGTYPVPLSSGIRHPAHVGDALVIYAIGFGSTSPSVATGAAASSMDPLARVTTPVRVLFGNRLLGAAIPVEPTYVGLTHGFVGLFQIKVTIP